VILDTHVVLWLALEPQRMSKKARSAIEEARQRGAGLHISDITLLEIATLHRKARLKLLTTLETFLSEVEARFTVLPITARVCVRAMSLQDSYPKDPADRIIGAMALVEGVPLVTADEKIRRSTAVTTIW